MLGSDLSSDTPSPLKTLSKIKTHFVCVCADQNDLKPFHFANLMIVSPHDCHLLCTPAALTPTLTEEATEDSDELRRCSLI